jgi:sulfatase maturation enzyme AslB (radical SAM superfamily)
MGGVLKMGSIARRIERAEERLGLDQAPIIVNVVWFGGEPVPPEQRRDNVIIRHVAYESRRKAAGQGHGPR